MHESLSLNISSEQLITFMAADFLDLGQLRAEKFSTIDKTFKVAEPVEEVLNILQFKAAHKHVNVRKKFKNITSESLIRCDVRRVTQVLLNLVSNALKFTSANGKVDIEVSFISSNEDLLDIHPDLQPFI